MWCYPDRNRMFHRFKRSTYDSEYSREEGVRMYAIIETGGKQYKVEEGQSLSVELLHKEEGETVEIDKVLMLQKDGALTVGKPFVDGAKVTLKVVENAKAKKIVVFKFKAKKNYRRKAGHRQPFTKVIVEKIEG